MPEGSLRRRHCWRRIHHSAVGHSTPYESWIGLLGQRMRTSFYNVLGYAGTGRVLYLSWLSGLKYLFISGVLYVCIRLMPASVCNWAVERRFRAMSADWRLWLWGSKPRFIGIWRDIEPLPNSSSSEFPTHIYSQAKGMRRLCNKPRLF